MKWLMENIWTVVTKFIQKSLKTVLTRNQTKADYCVTYLDVAQPARTRPSPYSLTLCKPTLQAAVQCGHHPKGS